jgi:hypothetical protein
LPAPQYPSIHQNFQPLFDSKPENAPAPDLKDNDFCMKLPEAEFSIAGANNAKEKYTPEGRRFQSHSVFSKAARQEK